jgi:hypothetical protein
VIVHDLNIVRIPIVPNEAQAPFVIDPYAVLPGSVIPQCFQAIPGRCCQISQFRSAVQLPKLSAGNALNGLKAPACLPIVKSLSFRATEQLDHEISLYYV